MSAHPTNIPVYAWDSSIRYRTNDICSGNAGYYYATQDNVNSYHTASWTKTGTHWDRVDGLVTIAFTSPMSPPLARGSWVEVSASGNGAFNINYTGTITDGGTGFISFPSPGPDASVSVSPITISSSLNPAWTTGFGWIPSYSTDVNITTSTVEAKFDGYSQRMRNSINSIINAYSLNFDDRSDREVVAIMNFVQDKGGVDSFRINMGSALLGGNPLIKYIALNPKVSPRSKNINSLTVSVTQVFDP